MRVSNRLVLVYVLTVMSLIAVGGWFVAGVSTANAQRKVGPKVGKTSDASVGKTIPATVGPGPIAGTGTGPIPDGGPGCGPFGSPLLISFDGAALSGTITDVSIDMTANHSWVGDVRATLVAPDATEHLLFSDVQSTSATGCGDSSDLGNTYTYSDDGAGDWWAESLNGTGAYVMAAGDYRTSTAGDVPGGGAATDMNAAFAAANPTGVWTLRVEDGGGGDTGDVTAANLTVTTAAPPAPTLLNEIVVNPNSTDSNCEYVEFLGAPSGALTGLYFVSLEGDSNKGNATFVADLTAGALGANGLLVIAGDDPSGTCDGRDYGAPSGTVVVRTSVFGGSGGLQNGTNSFLLINSPTTALTPGTDYDTNDDGTLDALPGDATIVDGIANNDGGGTDVTYGGVDLPTPAGSFGNDMATRFPDNITASSAAAWYHGDMDGGADSTMYDTAQVSSNFPANGALTPGAVNVGTAVIQKANTDFDGDGLTDFNIVRDATTMFSSKGRSTFGFRSVREKMRAIERFRKEGRTNKLGAAAGTTNVWYINNSQSGSATIAGFGTAATDFIVPEDYDGDGRDDLAVWRGLSPTTGSFFIFESSTSTVRQEMFGQSNDNPTVAGDYDGDGKADVAVFRCPPIGGGDGQCFFFFRGSGNNPGGDITYVPWGFGETLDFFPNPGDFDGDGKYDFCIQRTSPTNPAQGQFVLLNSADSSVQFIDWGGPNDFIVPGDYDGDGRSDFMVRRTGSNPFQWYLLESDGGGTGAAPILWGSSGDAFAPGDYDGDGQQDIAIWRPNADSASNFFYVRRSSDSMLQIFEWGEQFDFPAAGWNVN